MNKIIAFIAIWMLVCISCRAADDCASEPEAILRQATNLAATLSCGASLDSVKANLGAKQSIPLCPNGIGFRPLGSYYPPSGVFVTLAYGNNDFVLKLAEDLKLHAPGIPLNIITPNRLADTFRKALPPDLGKSIRLIPVIDTVALWQQDAYEFGVLGPTNQTTVLNLPFSINWQLPRHIAEACILPRIDPPSLAAPESDTKGNRGGNIEAFVGGVVAVGNNMSASEMQLLQEQGNELVPLNTSFLNVGHVDELFNIVRTNSKTRKPPCDFAINSADIDSAVRLLATDRNVHLPGDTYKSGTDILGSSTYSFEDFDCGLWLSAYNAALKKGYSDIKKFPEVLLINCKYQQLIQSNLAQLQAALETKTGCRSIPVLKFPQMWDQAGVPIWPNAVNSLVLNQHMVVSDTKVAAFNNFIVDQLKTAGVTASFLDDSNYWKVGGDIHCGTNVIRSCETAH